MYNRIKIILIAFTLCFFSLSAQDDGVNFVEGKTFIQLLDQAKHESKLVFIDCYTSWCGPCRIMATKVFPQKIMGDYFNPRYVCAKIDMEKGEGIDLHKKFNVSAYPTFLILDSDGNELHRIVGGDQDCRKFIDRCDAVNSGNTVPMLTRRYEAGEKTPEFLNKYLNALNDANDNSRAKQIAAEILKGRSAELLADSALFDIFVRYDNNLFSDNFQYFLSNLDRFSGRYGSQPVDSKVQRVWMLFPYSLVSKNDDGTSVLDMEGLKRYRDEVRKWNADNADRCIDQAEITIAEHMGQWNDFAAKCSDFLTKYSVDDIVIYNWARRLSNASSEPALRDLAIKWSEQRIAEIDSRTPVSQDPGVAVSMVNGPQFKSAFEKLLKSLKSQ